jgi:hypothetical protein
MNKLVKPQHIHKFKRLRYKSGNEVFFCTLPDCNQKINPSLALGKRCICWRCGNPFIMNEYSLRLAKPHCDACHKPKVEKIDGDIIETSTGIVQDIVNESLMERLNKTIQQAQTITPEEEEI